MIAHPAYPPPPLAPVDSVVSAAGATVALVSLSVVGVLGLAWAVTDGVRRRDPDLCCTDGRLRAPSAAVPAPRTSPAGARS